MKSDSEILITLLGAFAQAESESISANVRWGTRQAMREGRAKIYYYKLYGYEKGENGEPKIIPEQAEVVRKIYRDFLSGASLRMIKQSLEEHHILNVRGEPVWNLSAIRGILKSEKYCGDVLMQKTFSKDCISKKIIVNTGQLPMYLIQDHHEAIVDRSTYQAVQLEFARRSAMKSPSKKHSKTGNGKHSGKYALSDRVFCGECGSRYRRVTWTMKRGKIIVWRCISRLEYGKKYCRKSPTVAESVLHAIILSAINMAINDGNTLIQTIAGFGESDTNDLDEIDLDIPYIDQRLLEINEQLRVIAEQEALTNEPSAHIEPLQQLVGKSSDLKLSRNLILEKQDPDAEKILDITQWDESLIRLLVDAVRIVSADEIEVYLRGGMVITRPLKK